MMELTYMKIFTFLGVFILLKFLNSLSVFYMCFLLIIFSFVTSLFLWANLSHWLFLACGLVYLGGLMILFSYLVTMSSVQKFMKEWSTVYPWLLSPFIFLSGQDMNFLNSLCLSNLYDYLHKFFIFLLLVFILFNLVMVVRWSESYKGSLKSFRSKGG